MGIAVKVISASRRVDMVAGYPELLIETLTSKCAPEKVHTIVIWTKNASNLLHHNKLRFVLSQYDQIFLQYSITGMGASILEPNIPLTDKSISMLPDLITLCKIPERVRIRFDPIVHLKLANGSKYTNIHEFKHITSRAASYGLRDIVISWMQLYKKVNTRLRSLGIEPLGISKNRWQAEHEQLQLIASRNNIVLHGCCVPDMQISSCIDGKLFNKLHPKGFTCSVKKAKGQRQHCGCTESWDIGWYYSCVGGCIYCYANPDITATHQSE